MDDSVVSDINSIYISTFKTENSFINSLEWHYKNKPLMRVLNISAAYNCKSIKFMIITSKESTILNLFKAIWKVQKISQTLIAIRKT